MQNQNNVVVLGAKGFIGGHLVHLCKAEHLDSHLFDINADPDNSINSIDVRNPIKAVTERCSAIFNLAAVHKTPGHIDHAYFDTNINGANNVTNFAKNSSISTIVFTSSIAPYGADEQLKTEETLPKPTTPYGISKLVAEYIHRCWQAECPLERRLIIVRPGIVFGHGENGNMTRLASALNSRRFSFPGRKDTVKACIYVKDVARLMLEMAKKTEPGIFVYNLTYDPAPTIENICETICAVTGYTKPRLVIPGSVLKGIASCIAPFQGLSGIHPDRVRKLMVSTNISGRKLIEDGYTLKFSLHDAIQDWWEDCGKQGLF